MPVSNTHPEYDFRAMDWKAIRDSIQGQRAVKDARHTYLPVPPGMSIGSNEVLENGKRVTNDRYSFYLSFAEFPELVSPVLNGFQGIIHATSPHIELPAKMEYLLEDSTPEGDSLVTLWKRVTREVLAVGRLALLMDVGSDDRIRFACYSAENIINWRIMSAREGGGPSMVVLREFAEQLDQDDEFEVEEVTRYRELRLLDGTYQTRLFEGETGEDIIEDYKAPTFFGLPFGFIPIVVFNAVDTGFDFEAIPILPLVRRALSIYRLSADYRRALYIKGDPQIVISGITQDQAPTKIGGESIWCLPNPQAEAKYLDIDGQGIPLMKEAISDEYERFYQEGGKLLDTADRSAESGEALRRRQVAQQVSLRDIAGNGGSAFEQLLKLTAVVMGEDPDAVRFEPDLDFAEPNIGGQELMELMTAKQMGAPISQESIHGLQKRGGLTNLTFDVEMEKIRSEDPLIVPTDPDPEIEEPDAGQ